MPEALLHTPVEIFLVVMAIVLITPILSERVHLPGIIGLIVGGMLVGPFGMNWLAAEGIMEMFAEVGLLYLMFNAGLEVDLHQFNRVRRKSLLFGLLTYCIPQALGIALGRALGMGWMGSVLLGSAIASHTLIAFPVVARLGIVTDEAIAVTIGATVFTDVTAFLVLAVIANTPAGGAIELWSLLKLVGQLLIYAGLILFAVPRLGKLFFRRFSSRTVEFQFMLVVLLVAAFGAEQIGIHAVVGAFLAGLAISSALPSHSAVGGQVLFVGESFFIPIFLMYSGMITDPKAFVVDMGSLLAGLGLTAMAYAAKLAAAWSATRLLGYSRAQMWAVWGLSQAQAAVTLPTMLIGVQLGLFSQQVFNGAIMMILFTSITSPMIVQRFGRQLSAGDERMQPALPFDRILVPVANPQTQENLLSLASLLVDRVHGTLYPLHVLREVNGKVQGLEQQRLLMERLPEILHDPDTPIQLLQRVDSAIGRGILRSAVEQNASMIVMGWRGKSTYHANLFGSDVDEVLWKAHVPVLVARLERPINSLRRVVWAVLPDATTDDAQGMVMTLTRALNVPLLVMANEVQQVLLQKALSIWQHPLQFRRTRPQEMRQALLGLEADDLLVLVARSERPGFRSAIGNEPEQFAALFPGSIAVIRLL